MLTHAEENDSFNGVKVCHDAPAGTNLLFVDDSLILKKAYVQNDACLKASLAMYCSVSGHLVNVDKSSFFPALLLNMKAQVCSTLNIMTEAMNDKYLGLPATLGLDKSDSF